MSYRWDLAAIVVPLAMLVGCNDPVVGTWQSAEAFCDNAENESFVVESDLSGTATLIMGCRGGDGAAIVCPATVRFDEQYKREGSWDLQADIGMCAESGRDEGRGYKLCVERNAETELYCCDSDGSHCQLYKKIAD